MPNVIISFSQLTQLPQMRTSILRFSLLFLVTILTGCGGGDQAAVTNSNLAKYNIPSNNIPDAGQFTISNTIYLNDFTADIYDTNITFSGSRTASVYFDSNHSIKYSLQLDTSITQPIVNSFAYGEPASINDIQIKQVVKLQDRELLLLGINDSTCAFASIYDATNSKVIFKAPCLPDTQYVDFNGIGGGYATRDGILYIAIGAPTASNENIQNLAQDPSSPYGKVLSFSQNDLDNPNSLTNFKIFTSGHRNIQGILNLNGTLIAVEQGPKGGDEINILSENKNYGWPLYSLGSSYGNVNFTAAGDPMSFTAPIYSFVPSVALSDITNCPLKIATRYSPYKCSLVSSLRGNSLYVILFDNDFSNVVSSQQISINHRIREFAIGDSEKFIFSTDDSKIFQLVIK